MKIRIPSLAFLYVNVVVSLGAAILVGSYTAVSWDLFPQMLLFVALIVVASFLIIQDPSGGVVSSTGTLFYVVLYVFDPVTAFLIVALGYSIGNTLPRNWVTWRVFFNAAQMGISVFLGSLAYRALGGNLSGLPIVSQVIPAIVGPIVHQIANNFFIAFLISLERGTRFLRTWLNFLRELLWANLLSIPTAILIAILYIRVHHAFALAFLLSLPFQRWALRLYLEKRNTYARIIEHLVRAGELSLPGTRGHAHRVARISELIGRQIGLAERDLEAIGYAALLHDIGMIGMDDEVNSEEARRSPERIVEAHVRLGAEIVSELGRDDITEMILNHHNSRFGTWDDSGRSSPKASLGARIIELAEMVDSQLHGLFPEEHESSLESVVLSISRMRGLMLDAQIVDAFLSLADGNGQTRLFVDSSESKPVGG